MEMMTRNPIREHNHYQKPVNHQGNGTKVVGSHRGGGRSPKGSHGQIMSGVGGAEVDAGMVLYSNTVEHLTLTNSSAHERAQEVAVHALSAVT